MLTGLAACLSVHLLFKRDTGTGNIQIEVAGTVREEKWEAWGNDDGGERWRAQHCGCHISSELSSG